MVFFRTSLTPPNAFLYPGVTHADISIKNYFPQEHARALMRRFPSLSHLTLGPDEESTLRLEWFAHPGVRHVSVRCAPSWLSATAAGPETFPALDSVDIRWSDPMSSLASAFATTGPFNGIRTLSMGVHMLDDELVRALDLLPRLESVNLHGGTLARGFVQVAAWMRPPLGSRIWRCASLQEVRLTDVKELEPVGPEIIVSWLSSGNSTSGAGAHAAIHNLQVEWESQTRSKVQRLEFNNNAQKLLATM